MREELTAWYCLSIGVKGSRSRRLNTPGDASAVRRKKQERGVDLPLRNIFLWRFFAVHTVQMSGC